MANYIRQLQAKLRALCCTGCDIVCAGAYVHAPVDSAVCDDDSSESPWQLKQM